MSLPNPQRTPTSTTQDRRLTTDGDRPPSIPYPAAVHLAIIHVISKNENITDDHPCFATSSKEMVSKAAHYLHSSSDQTVVDCCNSLDSDSTGTSWDLDTLLNDHHVGVLASCSDLVHLGVLVQSNEPDPCNPHIFQWRRIEPAASSYSALLESVIADPIHLSELKRLFTEYLACRANQMCANTEQLQFQDQLGDTTIDQAKSLLQQYYQQIHQYNETKDMAQSIIGRLALLDDTTINQVYKDLGVDPNEE